MLALESALLLRGIRTDRRVAQTDSSIRHHFPKTRQRSFQRLPHIGILRNKCSAGLVVVDRQDDLQGTQIGRVRVSSATCCC